MLYDGKGKILHDRATRGKPLSLEEQKLLEQWYNNQDDAESQLLKSNEYIEDEKLQKQIDTILIQIKSATDTIQRLTGENKLLKNDITNLHNQLSEKMLERAI